MKKEYLIIVAVIVVIALLFYKAKQPMTIFMSSSCTKTNNIYTCAGSAPQPLICGSGQGVEYSVAFKNAVYVISDFGYVIPAPSIYAQEPTYPELECYAELGSQNTTGVVRASIGADYQYLACDFNKPITFSCTPEQQASPINTVEFYQTVEKECTLPSQCEGLVHIECTGFWTCENNNCVWKCSDVPPPDDPLWGLKQWLLQKIIEIKSFFCNYFGIWC